MKLVSKSLLFSFVTLLLMTSLVNLFFPKNGELSDSKARTKEFYSLPRNSIDVMFFGASTFLQGITPMEMWRDYGFSAFVRSNGGQAAVVSYYFLVEALHYQNPKVVVIDMTSLFSEYDYNKREGRTRNAVDPMRFSFTKLRLINSIVEHDPEQSLASYLFPILRYHSRWSELSETDLDFHSVRSSIFKGFYGFRYGSSVEQVPQVVDDSGSLLSLSEDSILYFEKMIQLCAEKDIEVVILTMPRDDWDGSKHISLQTLADEYGVQYVDYNVQENAAAIQLEKSDIFDTRHLNTRGAQKVTHHFGAWLQEQYHLPDKRSNPAYAQWTEDLLLYENKLSRSLQAQ